MKRLAFCAYFLIFLSTAVVGKDTNFAWAAAGKKMKADFKQVRYIKTTNLKLLSSGYVEVLSNQINWVQLKPFENKVIVKSDRIILDSDSEEKGETSPIMKNISAIFFGIVNGDFTPIQSRFNIETKNNNHLIFLNPKKDDIIAKFIKKIIIRGKKNVSSIKLLEQQGNYLEINFSNHKKL